MDRHTKTTIDTYNAIAKRYAAANNTSSFWKKEFSLFTRCLRGRTVLEIGCGGGRDAALFLKKKYRYLGIDASRGLLKVAKQKNPGGTFRQMDLFRMTSPTGSFDGV
ncbi:MAG: class I SAM-dependent methyltransferase [Patescibacteria group bacterium]